VAPELSDKKIIEYDYQSAISLIGILITICFLFAGFAFTVIILFITSAEPITLLSQVIFFILFVAIVAFICAAYLLHFMNLHISMESPKPIIPICPTLWPTINALLFYGSWGTLTAIALTFLLRNLVILFVVSIIAEMVGTISMIVFYFLPALQKMRKKGILK
jgi:hypothetical protein